MLLTAYPAAAAVKAKDGLLPLSAALEVRSYDGPDGKAAALLAAYPAAACYVPSRLRSRLPSVSDMAALLHAAAMLRRLPACRAWAAARRRPRATLAALRDRAAVPPSSARAAAPATAASFGT